MRRLAGVLVLLAFIAACDTSNYAFTIDKTIEIVAPPARTEVPLPVAIRWRDDEPPDNGRVDPQDPEAEYYAVFLDRTPLGPGERLSSLVEEADECATTKGCPSAEQLGDMQVFLTAEPSVTLEFVADLRTTTRGDTKDVHEVTVVRMRGDERSGEAAFLQTFFIRR